MARRLATIVGLFVLMGILSAGESAKFWVFFTDKNLRSRADTLAALEKAKSMLTPRCLARRAKVLSPDRIVDWRDIPIPREYVDAVKECGAEIVHRSRWFNAVSVRADSQTIAKIKRLPFVAKVRPVAVFREKILPEDFAYFVPAEGDAIYGLAKEQLRFMGIPPAHRMGIFGDGVLVCITDTGFNPNHIAVRHCDVVAEYDFVDGDSVVSYQPEDNPAIASHGTKCWSEIGGRVDSVYWGAAPEASFLLARTEDLDTEWVGEEDNWAAAAEWADSLGADVISVSLGYFGWYSAGDLDGDTPIITAAADRAAMLGIAVFVAAGNSGTAGYRTLVAPGDGDSVITVGACDGEGYLASFSSRGPTADGRLKPDILAHGVGTICANGMNDSTFSGSSGTSMATPMAAGVGTLLLSAKPSLSPMQLLHSLRMTASYAIYPDSAHGWGIISARFALAYPENDTAFVYLHAGWNLIALPVAETLTASQIPTTFPVYTYDGAEIVAADTLIPGRGYFVYVPADTFAVLCGPPITELTLNLSHGWNLVGGLSRRTFPKELDENPLCCAFFVLTEFGGYSPVGSLPPSLGGWFWSRRDTIVTLRE